MRTSLNKNKCCLIILSDCSPVSLLTVIDDVETLLGNRRGDFGVLEDDIDVWSEVGTSI
jgi:hypothetical protein